MKSRYLHPGSIISLIWVSLLFFSFQSFAQQCPDDNQFWFDGQQPPCNSYSSIDIGGGTYATFDVENGMVYTFNSCNSSFNTQLTGYDLSGNNLFFNDDNGPECTSDRASVEWTATLTGQIKVLVDSFPCTSFSATSAILQYKQTLTITSSNAVMCSGETRNLTANTAGGTFSGTEVTGSSFTAPSTGGSYTVTYSTGSCSATQIIQVNEIPTVSISSLDGLSFCSGDSVRLMATVGAGSGSITSYQWKRSGTAIGGNSANITVMQDGSYTVDVVNSNGCSGSSTPIVLTELQTPTVSFTGFDSNYCLKDPLVQLIGSPSGGTYNGPGIAGTSFNPTLAGVNSHSITYTYTAPNGCSNSETQTTTVNDQPDVIFNLTPGSYCTNDPAVQLSATPLGGVYTGPGIQGNMFAPSTAGAGSHWLVYTYSTPFGCISVDSVNIVVRQSPTVSFSGLNSDYCITDPSVTLTGSPSGGNFSGTGISGSTFVPFSAGVGSHTISYNYPAPNGCSATATKITIVNDKPIISFPVNPASYCVNDTPVTLNATPSGGTYSGPGVSGNTFNPAVAGVGGPFSISYTFTDTIGCRSTSSGNLGIRVRGLPSVTISGIGAEYCANASPVALAGNPSGGTFSGNGVSANTFYPDSAGTGIQQITYTYTDNNGCSNSNTASTIVQPLPVVALTGLDPVYCFYDALVLMTGTPSGGFYSGEGVIANSFNPGLAGAGGPYDIVYTYADGNGCSDTAHLKVTVGGAPIVSIIGLDSLYCAYEGTVLLALVPAGGQLTGSGVSGNSFNPSQAGVGNHLLVYIYSDLAGCVNSVTKTVMVDACVGISLTEVHQIKIYPNPAQNVVNVEISGGSDGTLSVFNMHGQKMIASLPIDGHVFSSTIDISSFPKGIYLFRLETDNGIVLKKIEVN